MVGGSEEEQVIGSAGDDVVEVGAGKGGGRCGEAERTGEIAVVAADAHENGVYTGGAEKGQGGVNDRGANIVGIVTDEEGELTLAFDGEGVSAV